MLQVDGSAKFTQGNTVVLVGVCGPRPAKWTRDVCKGNVIVSMSPINGICDVTEKDHAAIIKKVFDDIIDHSHYSRAVIHISIQVIYNDGSLLSAAINCTSMALCNAGISMFSFPISVTCSISSIDETIFIDPSAVEEEVRVRPF